MMTWTQMMMTRGRVKGALAIAAAALVLAPLQLSAARVGDAAPDFSVVDSQGTTRKLADFKGKFVVLEWHNPGCPYVGKHYESGNMQKLQQEWTAKGVVWLTVASMPLKADQANAWMKDKKAAQTAVLLDTDHAMARAYQAKTSPHMFVIDPKGTLIYNGAIDDKPTTDVADVAGARNFVSAALTDAMAGRAVAQPTSTPYGCGVKYSAGTSN